jgi:phytoene synthase
MNTRLATAYSVCRGIARREAKNFYYSFIALPREKRNALSAVYAFMRHADDISDDESIPIPERRARLNTWVEQWHSVLSGTPSDDPVFTALADAQHRFSIPPALLDQLVHGTYMDLQPENAEEQRVHSSTGVATLSSARTHQTFSDLYRYCYLVASVVGMVCIRVYGYEDPRAEELAERCGVAFQLTNIIRDVKEDAQMGRVYLPQEDLAQFGLEANNFLDSGGAAIDETRLRPLLQFEADRARDYYRSADELLLLIHEDSRPALWVMVTIYRRLLEKIAEKQYDVLHGRIRLSASEKVGILARGLARSVIHAF